MEILGISVVYVVENVEVWYSVIILMEFVWMGVRVVIKVLNVL